MKLCLRLIYIPLRLKLFLFKNTVSHIQMFETQMSDRVVGLAAEDVTIAVTGTGLSLHHHHLQHQNDLYPYQRAFVNLVKLFQIINWPIDSHHHILLQISHFVGCGSSWFRGRMLILIFLVTTSCAYCLVREDLTHFKYLRVYVTVTFVLYNSRIFKQT